MVNRKDLSDEEFEALAIKDAENIFQTLYYGLPATTFRKLLERIDKYNNEVDGN